MEALDVLSSADLRATLLHVRRRPAAPTAADVARELGIPVSVARWRLERLASGGLLVPRYARRSARSGPGAGRPAKFYAVAAESSQIEFPPRRYESLIRLLIAALPARARAQRLGEVGSAFGTEIAVAAGVEGADTPAAAADEVCRALGAVGFAARVESTTADSITLVTATCPLRPVVVDDPAAQAVDEGMWRGLLSAALASARPAAIACDTSECLGSGDCRVAIRLT